MKKIIIISLAIICIVLCIGACSEKEYEFDENYEYDGVSLIGKWREREYHED